MTAASRVKLGVLLPTRGLLLADSQARDAGLVLEMARQVESAGLDSVWVGDSLTAKPRLEPLSTLAAIAACTQRVRLGTAVLLAALRHPLLLAQTCASVDVISGGRLIITAGVGGAFNQAQAAEWEAAGVDAKTRATRLEEIVQIVKALAAGEPVTYRGRHFSLEEVEMLPLPVQPNGVPFLLACHWRYRRPAQLKRAARLGDGLISISDTPEEYAEMVPHLRGMVSDLGRDPDRFEAVMYLTVNVDPDTARANADATEFLTGYYGSNIWGDRWGPFGDPERVKERIAEYAEAGAETIIVRFASFEPQRQLETFLDKVAGSFF
jgi:alkanesulfonate monooxygenase SsuD/methylene tetrahydromethanopterin reductase-like flavin-dependent oxidoreductase (luciferase family)